MAYPKTLVLIKIWHSESKNLRIRALIKAFCRLMKISLGLRVRKSVLKELDLIKFDFLDLTNFIIDNKFLISPTFLSQTLLNAPRFFLLVLAREFRELPLVNLPVI